MRFLAAGVTITPYSFEFKRTGRTAGGNMQHPIEFESPSLHPTHQHGPAMANGPTLEQAKQCRQRSSDNVPFILKDDKPSQP